MCIIIYKNSKNKPPSDNELSLAEYYNPDGIGIAYIDNNTIKIIKGLKLDNLINLNDNLLYDKTVIYHFRYSTSGSTKAGLCHPFPLSSDLSKLCEIELSCDTVVAHNGHFLDYAGSKQYSDTQIFISKVLSKFKFEDLLNPKIRMLLNIITDENRLIIMNTSGKVTKFGNWIKSKGLYYSNNSLIRYNLVDDYYLDSKYDEKSFAEVSRGYTANKFCYLCGLPSSEVELKYDEFVKEYICEECRQTIRY